MVDKELRTPVDKEDKEGKEPDVDYLYYSFPLSPSPIRNLSHHLQPHLFQVPRSSHAVVQIIEDKNNHDACQKRQQRADGQVESFAQALCDGGNAGLSMMVTVAPAAPSWAKYLAF